MLFHFIICMFTFPFTILALGTLQGSTSKAMKNIAKPGCRNQCGNVTVPYPFGIGKDTGCSLDDSFYVTCNSTSFGPPKLFLGSGSLEIFNISDSELRIKNFVSYKCYNQDGLLYEQQLWWANFNLSQFTFSEKNKFTVIGCDDYGLISRTKGDGFSNGCFGLCGEAVDVSDRQCSGNGCCQTSITKGLKYYKVILETTQNHIDVWSLNNCGFAFLGEEGSFQFRGVEDLFNSSQVLERITSTVPVVLDWVIAPNRSCYEATECKANSNCYDVEGGGYLCKCNKGYNGNPYLDPGCQDVNECEDPRDNICHGDCINTVGSFDCVCPRGSFGDANMLNGCHLIAPKDSNLTSIILIIAMTVGPLAILLGITGFWFSIRRRKLITLREKFFEQNGGVLLKQKMSSQESHEALTLFSTEELRKATNNYSQDQILGRGAYGVVYKGHLFDKRVAAIKKSKPVDVTQVEQFINEVLILTQVVHRNVVKLLGCCLEEEVPVLVYEFVSNNTLYHHLHDKLGGMSWLSWENRLRVAAEAARALAYLHSESKMPIIHRDVKSTNILLDDNYTAKISDLGASRLVPLDHDQVTSLIQGTLGYLDPQYFHTSHLTEKSDVYSFGVVLAELMTGKKPIGADRINEEKNLATYFVNSVEENRLLEIVEPRLLREGTVEQLQGLADLVKRCLNPLGRDRPTMKEVAVELEGMMKFTTHPWIQRETFQETSSVVLEVEQSDLHDVPLVSYGTNERDSYSGSTHMAFEEYTPR